MARKTLSEQCQEFLRVGQAALVLRGYNRVIDIDDPLLKEVWRLGRKVTLAKEREESWEGR